MSYIGNQPPDIGAYDVESFDGGGTSFTLKKSATTPSVLLFIDGVRQTPTDAYSVSGVTLTTTGTTPAGTDNVTVMFMGDVVDIGAPSNDTVTNAKMADDAIGIAELSATGAASATTFLRGDNSWVVPTDTVYNDAGLQDDIALLGFKVASNGSLAKYNLVDQTVDDFQDTSGVDASASTNETRDASGKYYSGSGDGTTGGTASSHGSYTVRTFLTSGTFTTPDSNDADVLVVAGGGGGGARSFAGGGGAGGMRTDSLTLSGSYTVTVGDGGDGGDAGAATNSTKGGNSIFSTITSTGGGRGGDQGAGGDGGSGGGGTNYSATAGAGNEGAFSPVEGYAGGVGVGGSWGGAGGGAGAVGGGGTGPNTGGVGVSNDYRTGSGVFYAGGGGSGRGGTGGNGGGGDGGDGSPESGSNGTVNSGGGGGGANDEAGGGDGGNGGSGIVVVRWSNTQWLAYDDMTLVSTTTAAQEAPTKGDIVLTYTNGAGTTTLDTDLTAEISADGGSTWTALALASEGSTGSHNIATSHDVTISSTITAPYNMAYRIKTLNQSVSKTTRIQAVSLGWS